MVIDDSYIGIGKYFPSEKKNNKGGDDYNATEDWEMIMHKLKICKKAFKNKVSLDWHNITYAQTLQTDSKHIFHCKYCKISYQKMTI